MGVKSAVPSMSGKTRTIPPATWKESGFQGQWIQETTIKRNIGIPVRVLQGSTQADLLPRSPPHPPILKSFVTAAEASPLGHLFW